MYQINTTTKKFTEAVTIDLGQLPTVDTRIDFILTDGTNPVIAENKTFAMTIGTVLGSLYKTDADTVSFRYLKFNDDNIADSLVITMTMDGVEILNDVVSLKYQRECVDKDALEEAINAKADKATTIAGYGITDAYTKTEIDAKVSSVYHYKGTVSAYAGLPSSGQEVGDVWNIETADSSHGIKAGDNVAWTGSEWDALAGEIDLSAYATKTELETKLDAPAAPGTTGQVLTKTADGQEWADAPAGGGGDVPDSTDYLCFTAAQANSTVRLDKVGTPEAINLEYSTDKINWTDYTWSNKTGETITLANIGDSVWWRGDNDHFSKSGSNYYSFFMSGNINASGNINSLFDKSCTSLELPNDYCFTFLFDGCSALRSAPLLPAVFLKNTCYQKMFGGTGITEAPLLPAKKLSNSCYMLMFFECKGLTKAMLDFTSLSYSNELRTMFGSCSNLKKIKIINAQANTFGTTHSEYWLDKVSAKGVFECPSNLTISTRGENTVPAGWTIVRTDDTAVSGTAMNVFTSSDATVELSPSGDVAKHITVSSALTLSASASASTQIAYSEIVLDVAEGATVTAGTNLTLVDTPTAGKRNICVCRWSGGVCKLYVTIVEDLPQA